ncbi:type II toxin-antitoxin system VapC family toxin [Marinibaculum pumilum]|uniref:Type II toxin-antitoxin system VapC family toxin n=1 Tax=Marinibaculum pumilum TaxID=1766165 RepID=A0ABV7L2B6_9PROT
MRYLFDSHLLLWAAGAPARLGEDVLKLLRDPGTVPLFSAASLWEISIKAGLGRADFAVDPRLLRRRLGEHGWDELAITSAHAVATGGLPPLHKDPFDRMLVAQAMVEGILLLTSDRMVAAYPAPVRLV